MTNPANKNRNLDKGLDEEGQDISEEFLGDESFDLSDLDALNYDDNGNVPDGENIVEEEADEVEILAGEVADLKDKQLRILADMENLRRRAEREKSEATLYAATNFARDLLSVGDNLTRALETMPKEAREQADEATQNLMAGIELTQRELNNTLERHNIHLVDPKGEPFDPNLHQAMFELADDEAAPGTVVQVLQTGYKIGERVLRPAMVGVAKANDETPED